jgi:uroporphyrinogen-III decarboxylase
LDGQAWFAEHIVHDQRMGVPEELWTVTPRFWMDVSDFFGCRVEIQEDQFAWSEPLPVRKEDLLGYLKDLDPAERVPKTALWRLYQAMKELAVNRSYRDIPVHIGFPGGSSHGLFTEAARIRGIEQTCVDLIDDPDFARQFLELVADKLLGRMRAWHALDGREVKAPTTSGWGTPDDSIQLVSPSAYERIVLPVHQRIYSAMTSGKRHMHLCGYAEQHYRVLYHSLGITLIDGPGPFVDHGRWLDELPDLRFNAQGNHTVLMLGPTPRIAQMMERIMAPRAKQPGRFQVLGFLAPQTPLAHVQAMYDAGKQYGRMS